MKVPKAVETLAQGLANWMCMTRQQCEVHVEPDGTIVIISRASGRNVDPAEQVRQLKAVLEEARAVSQSQDLK